MVSVVGKRGERNSRREKSKPGGENIYAIFMLPYRGRHFDAAHGNQRGREAQSRRPAGSRAPYGSLHPWLRYWLTMATTSIPTHTITEVRLILEELDSS
jgi:hypothetical protein